MSARKFLFATLVFGAIAAQATTAGAQITGYGVNSAGQLFKFDVNAAAPAPTTNIGAPLTFVPEGIDFRPSTSTLYAIDISANTAQLYTIDISTGAPTVVGAGFPVSGVGYDLSGNQTFGFDFNPKTLQPDTSMRIRLVGSAGSNLRLHSATGGIAAIDTALAYAAGDTNAGNSPFVDAAAYENNIAGDAASGTTLLRTLDPRNDDLLTQIPPNDGILNTIGSFGLSIDAQPNTSFDIYTDPSSGGNFGYAVFKRPDAPVDGPLGSYLLYDVNLAGGPNSVGNGRLVGSAITPADFTGGFAVVPEPSSVVLACLAVASLGLIARRRIPLAV